MTLTVNIALATVWTKPDIHIAGAITHEFPVTPSFTAVGSKAGIKKIHAIALSK